MSVYQDRDVTCPSCGSTFVRSLCVSLNGNRVPAVVDEVRAGRFQRFACPSCGQDVIADGPLIYTDFERRHWVGCFPRTWEGAWRELEHQSAESFRRAMIDHAAPIMRAEADGYVIRTVFGLPALAEKILAFDHGLDDIVLELLKLEMMRSPDAPEFDLDRRFRFLDTDAGGGVLRFAVGEATVVRVPRGWYDHIAARLDDYATAIDLVAAGPYVDAGRAAIRGDADIDWGEVKVTSTFANLGPATTADLQS